MIKTEFDFDTFQIEIQYVRIFFKVSELRAVEEKCRLYVAATKLDLVDGQRNRQVFVSV